MPVSLPSSRHEYNAFTHGFATTIHKSQGMTADYVHLFADRSMNKHMMYVGMSRHRKDLNVVTPEGAARKGPKYLERCREEVRSSATDA